MLKYPPSSKQTLVTKYYQTCWETMEKLLLSRPAGWVEDEYLHRQAGLLRSHVVALTTLSIKEAEKEEAK